MSQGARLQGFWNPLAHLEVEGPNFFLGARMCHKTAGFYHVLSVMTCFCAVSLSGTIRSAMSVLLEETAFGGHVTAACPRSAIHAGQKCPQFCGIGRSWMLNKLYFELVPQKDV